MSTGLRNWLRKFAAGRHVIPNVVEACGVAEEKLFTC